MVDTFVDDDGDTIRESTTYSGTVASDGTVKETSTYEVTLNGAFWFSGASTFSGTLVGNTVTGTETGQDLVGDTCQWTATGTNTRSAIMATSVNGGLLC